MTLPFFPMYPSDFEAKTSHLTILEDGAYNRLLRLCWMTPGCSLPADEAWIMRRARAHTEEEKQAVRTILEEFFRIEKGRYSNARIQREFFAASEAHEKRKNAGSKGGKSKSLKTNDTASSNAVAKPKQPEPEPEPEVIGGGDAGAREDLTHRETLIEAMGADPASPIVSSSGKVIGGMSDMAEIDRWRQLGVSDEDQIAVVREVMARKRDGPPMSFKFFTKAMQRFAASANQPPLAPAIGDRNDQRTNPKSERQLRIIQAAAIGAPTDPWG